jgi:uncharacterized membrane protein YGL010W
MAMRSLAEQMYVYATYHRHPGNKAFHFLGVPMVTFAVLIPMAMVGTEIAGFPVTLASLFALAMLVYYFRLDAALAIAAVPLAVLILIVAHWTGELAPPRAWSVFAAALVVGSVIILVGHMLEGRRPPRAQALAQGMSAPLFLLAEVVILCGGKRALQDEVAGLLARNAQTRLLARAERA